MSGREKRNPRWDAWMAHMTRERDQLETSLAEAQRRFATASDDPFSPSAAQRLVARATQRLLTARCPEHSMEVAEFVFATEVTPRVEWEWPAGVTDQLCGLTGGQFRTGWNHLTTVVSSASVDMRVVSESCAPPEARRVVSHEPVVFDVGASLGDLATRQLRMIRDGTARSDVLLDAAGSEMLGYTVAYSVSFGFADSSDEAIGELLRN